MSDLLVATNNPGKRAEFRRMLAALPARLVIPADLALELVPDEPHDTYAENARAKADAFCRATGLVTLTDDAGIEVAALDWGPGVQTADFGDGRDGVTALLERLDGVRDRRARMICCLALAIPAAGGVRVELFEGVVEGSIAESRRGEGGFGFDPIFELPEGRTTAEIAPEEKDRVSHRGRAVAAALPRLHEVLATGEPALGRR